MLAATEVRVFGGRTEAWLRFGEVSWSGAEAVALPSVVMLSLGWLRNLDAALQEFCPDIVHVHGLWSLCGVTVREFCQRTNVPYTVSPHGMLSAAALRHRALKKRVAMSLYQRSLLEGARFIHATSAMEVDDIRRAGFLGRIECIPNGVSVSRMVASSGTRTNSYVLFLGRLAKIKGLDRLIAAWATVESEFPDWSLQIVGPPDGRYGEELKAQVIRHGVTNVIFKPPVQGIDRDELIAKASLLVLPSLSENFGLVVAEALMLGVPVVCSRGTPWSEVETQGAGLWVESEQTPLAEALQSLMRLSEEQRRVMGLNGRAWAMESFSWPNVASNMLQAYQTP
jgi:glycosyltransferase involved in cell wall biosynthesis